MLFSHDKFHFKGLLGFIKNLFSRSIKQLKWPEILALCHFDCWLDHLSHLRHDSSHPEIVAWNRSCELCPSSAGFFFPSLHGWVTSSCLLKSPKVSKHSPCHWSWDLSWLTLDVFHVDIHILSNFSCELFTVCLAKCSVWEECYIKTHRAVFHKKKLRGGVRKVCLSHECSFCKNSIESISGYSHKYKNSIKLFYDWVSVSLNDVILYRQKLLLGSSYPMGWESRSAKCARVLLMQFQQ